LFPTQIQNLLQDRLGTFDIDREGNFRGQVVGIRNSADMATGRRRGSTAAYLPPADQRWMSTVMLSAFFYLSSFLAKKS
jgi:hypothetical protein